MYAYYLANLYLDNRLREPSADHGRPAGRSRAHRRAGLRARDARRPHRAVASAWRTTALLGRRPASSSAPAGHIAGVVSPPGKKSRRHYWVNDEAAPDADQWLARAARRPGSWWPHWIAWLAPHAGAMTAAPAAAGSARHPPQDAAPGRYVREPAD